MVGQVEEEGEVTGVVHGFTVRFFCLAQRAWAARRARSFSSKALVPESISAASSFSLAQRASTALRAASDRCSGVRFSAVAFPPFRPSATAAAFFGDIRSQYHAHSRNDTQRSARQ